MVFSNTFFQICLGSVSWKEIFENSSLNGILKVLSMMMLFFIGEEVFSFKD